MKTRKLLTAIGLVCSMAGFAQGTVTSDGNAYGDLFRQSVKSCDEFMRRFNEEELFPNLDASDPELLAKNFLLLFDCKLAEGKDKEAFLEDIGQFHDAVKACNAKLKYDSKDWYAELRAKFSYKKKSVELGLVLQPERSQENLPCWAVVGINGLEKIGYADAPDRLAVSPEQHEALFVEIESDFKYSSKTFSRFRSHKARMDALSYFFALVESGTLTFQNRLSTRFHFFDIPSYVFCVEYHERTQANTGWLISSYSKADETTKNAMLNQLLGK